MVTALVKDKSEVSGRMLTFLLNKKENLLVYLIKTSSKCFHLFQYPHLHSSIDHQGYVLFQVIDINLKIVKKVNRISTYITAVRK